RCSGCSSILSVPAWPAPRRLPLLRIAGGATAGLVTLAVLAMALKPAPQPPSAPPAPSAAVPTSAPPGGSEDHGFLDDPVARLKRELQIEFPDSRFVWSFHPRPFVVALESSGRQVGEGWTDEFAEALELASTVFRREIADRLNLRPVRDTLLPVLVLSSRAAFDRYYESRNH